MCHSPIVRTVCSRRFFGRLSLTDQTMLCYNSTRGAWTDAPGHRASGQDSSGCTSLRFPVDKTPEFGYMGWKQSIQATRLTVRKDRKIKGFQLTR